MKHTEKDDEFYGIEFSQLSEDGIREVYPVTYAVMTWWKVRMDNEDIIDISEDSLSAILQYEATLEGDEDTTNLSEGDEIGTANIIEVNEESKMVTLMTYFPTSIPDDLVIDLYTEISSINQSIPYGHFEVFVSKGESGEEDFWLRYRVSSVLKGIKSGKVEAVENIVAWGRMSAIQGFNLLASNESIKSWLTQADQ